MPGFCIDELSFRHVVDLPVMITMLNDQLSTIHNQHLQQVFKSSELDYIEVVEGIEFYSLLYDRSHSLIDHDDRILLIQTIDKCIVWDADAFEIPDGELSFNGKTNGCASILFVTAKALEGTAVGIISACSVEGDDVCAASIGNHKSEVFQVGLRTQLDRFYRFQMCFERVSRNEFGKWVHLAFPRLRFALQINTQIRRFRQNYEDIRATIVEHLAAINDEFISDLDSGIDLPTICNKVKARCGVDISPESGNTHRNTSAMSEREVVFNGQAVVCEFHSKLHPTHDRIHFSPRLFRDGEDTLFLVIGPFAEHLTT